MSGMSPDLRDALMASDKALIERIAQLCEQRVRELDAIFGLPAEPPEGFGQAAMKDVVAVAATFRNGNAADPYPYSFTHVQATGDTGADSTSITGSDSDDD